MSPPEQLHRRTVLSAALSLPLLAAAERMETLSDWLSADRRARAVALKSSLNSLSNKDAAIRAWVQVLPRKSNVEGPLSGIPFGVKDVIETRGLATEYGSPVYHGRVGKTDAAIVTQFQQRGAVLLGKTQTAAFAMRDPPPTRNPRNLNHTPGGSSSGSAAAVAAGMVPFAVGTQTAGSVIRPASYCGVTGFKPSFGLFPLDGVLPFARSLDTIGFFTHTPVDMIRLWESLGRAAARGEELELGVPDPLPEVEPAMTAGIQRAVQSLRAAGVACRPVDLSAMLSGLMEAQRTIMQYEGARVHYQRVQEYGDRLGYAAELVQAGMKIPAARYDEAVRFVSECRIRIAEVYKATPVILTPAATGPAPLGLAWTGDSRMNTPWTALGTPAIAIPMPVRESLPLGLQLTALPGEDGRLLRAAVAVHRALETA